MSHTTFDLTSRDGVHYTQLWTPANEPRAIVCLVHGFGEHTGRYAHVAAHLNRARYALLGFDLRGHGKSHGQRGHTPSFDHLMDDITLLLGESEKRFPGKPLFLYGHSMGGNLVLNYGLRRKPRLAGVIATSPWLKLVTAPPGLLVGLGRVMNRVMPTYSQASNLDARGLSRDAGVVSAYQNDPLVHGKISARLSINMIDGGVWAIEHAGEFSLPLLIEHGTADPIVSFDASREFASRARGDVTFKAWEGLYHETHNEPEKAEVLDFMLGWLDKHTPA